MISENKENDRKSHKLDDDGGGSSFNWNTKICATESTIYLNVIMYFKRPVIFGEHLLLHIFQVIVLVVIIGLFIVKVKSDLRDKD
ncbi:unnamed protein product [Rhizophagus irregularis]|nr:unnamed protein product [Rhizophagus irregularis]CAB5383866.1 unnamed protein product [Rhizophagus irregularis]